MPLASEDFPMWREAEELRSKRDTIDHVLDALARYPERDDAIERLERDLIDERLNRVGSAREDI